MKQIDKQWECRKVKLKDIMPNKKNPRTITKDKFERLKKKIEEVGFHSPIKVTITALFWAVTNDMPR